MTKQQKRRQEQNKKYFRSYEGVLSTLYNNYSKMLKREYVEDLIPTKEEFVKWCEENHYAWLYYEVYCKNGYKKAFKPRLYRIGGGYSLPNMALLVAKDCPKNGKVVVATINGVEYRYGSAGEAAKALGIGYETVKKGASGISKTRCCELRYGNDFDEEVFVNGLKSRYQAMIRDGCTKGL